MARTIFAMIALVALAAPVSALELFEPELPPLPQLDGLQTAGAAPDPGATGSPETPGAPALGLPGSSGAEGDGDHAECRPVVALRLSAWGGIAGEQRRGLESLRLLAPVRTAVPTTADVGLLEQAVGTAALAGLPIQLVKDASGLEVLSHAEVAVRAHWTETYVTWTPVQQTFALDPAVGLPLVLTESAWVRMSCDPHEEVYDYIPSLDMTLYQYSSPVEMDDGWVTEIVSLDVRLAELADADLELVDGSAGTGITNEEVLWAVWRAIDMLDLDNLLALLPLDIINILLTQAEAGGEEQDLPSDPSAPRRVGAGLDGSPIDTDGSDGAEDDASPYSLASALPAVAAQSGLWMLLAGLLLLACLAIAYAANGKRQKK